MIIDKKRRRPSYKKQPPPLTGEHEGVCVLGRGVRRRRRRRRLARRRCLVFHSHRVEKRGRRVGIKRRKGHRAVGWRACSENQVSS